MEVPWNSETTRVHYLHVLLYWPLPAFFTPTLTLSPTPTRAYHPVALG